MSILSTSTPDEIREIAEKASAISKEASKQTQESVYRHEKQAKEFASEKIGKLGDIVAHYAKLLAGKKIKL